MWALESESAEAWAEAEYSKRHAARSAGLNSAGLDPGVLRQFGA